MVFELESFLDCSLNAQMHGGNTPPATPRGPLTLALSPKYRGEGRIAGRKVGGGGRDERAGACGARWPSGARSSRLSQTIQVAGARRGDSQRRRDTKTQRGKDFDS